MKTEGGNKSIKLNLGCGGRAAGHQANRRSLPLKWISFASNGIQISHLPLNRNINSISPNRVTPCYFPSRSMGNVLLMCANFPHFSMTPPTTENTPFVQFNFQVSIHTHATTTKNYGSHPAAYLHRSPELRTVAHAYGYKQSTVYAAQRKRLSPLACRSKYNDCS